MNLETEIASFLEKTPIKADALEAIKVQAAEESWQIALNTYVRFHDLALDVMTKNQIQGVDLEITKQRILDRLEASWLNNE